jgi:NitT/TauT family transport system substrate-binding protein
MMGRWVIVCSVLACVVVILAVWLEQDESPAPSQGPQPVVVSEAVHTLLYLPAYHAQRQGYFAEEGLSVRIDTAGTPTNAISALISGNADFVLADPMYVPISRQNGAHLKVVGEIVGRIALWALARNPGVTAFDYDHIKGHVVSTNQRPTTAYTYTQLFFTSLGLVDGQNVRILQTQPGSEVAPLLSGEADFTVALEPGAATAEVHGGAHVVYSWPASIGPRVFAGLSTREQLITEHRQTVVRFVRAISRALTDIQAHPDDALITAQYSFPQIEPKVLQVAVARLIHERVFPESPFISEASWSGAVEARRFVGDLKSEAPYLDNFDTDVVRDALHSDR